MNPNPPAPTAGIGPAGMAIKVGVMGRASAIALPEHMEKAHALGSAVAELLRLYPMPPRPSDSGVVEDPVCGMRILPRAAVAERVRDGTRYWFCSRACAERFDARPTASSV